MAESHPTNQRVVQLVLEPTGAELTIVDNGREAADLFRPARFDLVLMDTQMPLMDGLTATREIRRREKMADAPPTPIAMFTAGASDEHRAAAVEAGADDYIAKPVTAESLIEGITRALRCGNAECRPSRVVAP